jgi:Domain of unknown function (DUF5625)
MAKSTWPMSNDRLYLETQRMKKIFVGPKFFASFKLTRWAQALFAVVSLSACSDMFVAEKTEHDLSKKGQVSQLSIDVRRNLFTNRVPGYELYFEIPRDLVGPCDSIHVTCILPGPFRIRLVNDDTHIVLFDKTIQQPNNNGGGAIGSGGLRRPYVIARLFKVKLPPGTYTASVENLVDDPRFTREKTWLTFQYIIM